MGGRTGGRAALVGLLAGAMALTACSGSSAPATGRAPSSEPSPTGRTTAPATTSTPPVPDLARFYSQKLRWRGCRDGFQCAEASVPVDYANPAGRTISLALVRLPASDHSHRIGSLLVNPGGPGASGYDYGRGARRIVSAAVRARYDVVGFDPRGIGRSAELRCQTDRETDEWLAADGSPDDAAEEHQLEVLSRRLGARCLAKDRLLLAHVGTRDVARDLDVLRAALGDGRLNLLGKSYGTYLGATYAELFPARVGRLVLDGALDPALSGPQAAQGQAGGFERALASFTRDCLKQSDCPLSGSLDHALGQVGDLFARVDRRSLPGRDGRRLTQSLAVLGVVAAMYSPDSWGFLRRSLRQALDGNGSGLLDLSDFYTDRSPSGRYTSASNDVIYAVTCLDRPPDGPPEQLRANAVTFSRQSPRFGSLLAWGDLPCTYWPVPPQVRPHRITAAGAAPILVVGTTRDPATPYSWAQALAGELASGVLLTYVGDGHTAYRKGSSCIDSAVDAFLLHGTAHGGQRCR